MVGKLQRWWHISPILWYHRHLLSYLHSYSFTFSWCIEHRYVGFFFTVCLRFDIHISRNLWSFATACTWYSSFSHVRAISFSFNISIELVEIAPFFFLMSEPRHGGPETNHPIVQISPQWLLFFLSFNVPMSATVHLANNVLSLLMCDLHQV